MSDHYPQITQLNIHNKDNTENNKYEIFNLKNKNNPSPPAGNFKLHKNRCKVCERMHDNKQEWKKQ